MHYKLNTRDDTQYWRDCRANENMTATMRAIMEAWDDDSADFMSVLRDQVRRSSYAPYSWYCILSGMGRYGRDLDRQDRPFVSNPYREEVSGYLGHRRYLEGLQQHLLSGRAVRTVEQLVYVPDLSCPVHSIPQTVQRSDDEEVLERIIIPSYAIR